MCMSILPPSRAVTLLVCLVPAENRKGQWMALGMELQKVVSYSINVENLIHVTWKQHKMLLTTVPFCRPIK